MIGLRDLLDGAHLLQHPHGPIWVLIRQGRVIRAEWFDPESQAIVVWGSRDWRNASTIGREKLRRGLEEVRQAG